MARSRFSVPNADLASSGRPSIAVLPFANMSGDPEQEYFADGIVEDIITALSHIRWLFVIARNSSFVYKGKTVDVKQVGRELGVRYVLEGSVRKSGRRLRITGQLIDALTGVHLWADRFDGDMEDIFELQDQVAAKIVGTIAPTLEQAEIERATSKPTDSLDSYDHYLRGRWSFHRAGKDDIDEALRRFHKAIELDSRFSSAYGMASWCYGRQRMNGWVDEDSSEFAVARQVAEAGIECGQDDVIALAGGALVLGFVSGDFERAVAVMDRAIALNSNLPMAWHLSGWIRSFIGDYDLAVEHLTHALRQSPIDPQRPGMQATIAAAHFGAGRFELAASIAKAAILDHPNNFIAVLVAAAANAMTGNLDAARSALEVMRRMDPGLHIQNFKRRFPYQRPELIVLWEDALRKAGLPD